MDFRTYRFSAAVASILVVAGCRDAFRAHVDIVARAGEHELTVSRLAEIVASSPELPLETEVIESLARRWVEYSYLGQRAAVGDELLDSAIIAAAMWPDYRGAVIDSFHTMRRGASIEVTPSQVDSAYRVGDIRFLAHILRTAPVDAPPAQRDSQRQRIEQIRERLVAGGSWEDANLDNEDENARAIGGMLGPVTRGQTTRRFENAAFALSPAELSGVVETEFGFHLIYRPALEDVRDGFADGVRAALRQRADSLYEEDLVARRRLAVRGDAPAAAREAAAAPMRAKGSTKQLATYDGGAFTVDHLIRWLQFLPVRVRSQITTAPDRQLQQMIRSLAIREMTWFEADSAGITIPPEQLQAISDVYVDRLEQIQALTGLVPDSMLVLPGTQDQREEVAAIMVERYIERAARDMRQFVAVPPFLADQLMADGNWDVSSAGVRLALLRASELRGASSDSTAVPGGVR